MGWLRNIEWGKKKKQRHAAVHDAAILLY